MTFKPALTPEKEKELCVEWEDGWSIDELTIIYRVSRRTVFRVLAKHNMPLAKPRTTKRRKRKKPRTLQPCGTNAAYQRHRRKGEYPCPPCLEAHAAAVAAAKEKK